MLLIHPPVSKPCEPPAGIARLCGALDQHGVKQTVWDANLECLIGLLNAPRVPQDTWTHRASRHLSNHLASLRTWSAYQDGDRYRRSVKDLTRILEVETRPSRVRLGLASYEHEDLSPVNSPDLIRAAEESDENPFYPYFRKRLPELIEDAQPSFIGLSLNYLSQALSTFAIIGFLRRAFPDLKLILGGGLVTSWMRRPYWKNPFEGLVDHLVAGPGEGPLLSLTGAKPLEQKKQNPFAPLYDLLPLGDYFAPGPILPYSASTGCYWSRCSFCPEGAEGNAYTAIPVEEVRRDLHRLIKKHRPALVHFLDNAISPTLMRGISDDPPGVPWYGFARMTSPLTDLNFCLALKRSGCVMLQLGLESGDQRVLDSLRKGIDLEEASSILRNLKKAGIAAYVYLLFGTPPESLVEARKTLDFVARHHDCILFLNVAIFNMPIGGLGAQEVKAEKFYEGDLSLYTGFEHPKGWSRKRIRQFLDKEFKRHPAIANILRRDPPVFTSNHAPFFVQKGDGSIF